MRACIHHVALATLAVIAGCIEVPAYGGPDGAPADGGVDGPDGPDGGFGPSSAHYTLGQGGDIVVANTPTVLTYEEAIHDANGEYASGTFVPKQSATATYLVCASIRTMAGSPVALLVTVGGLERRIGVGTQLAVGCIAVELMPGNRLQVVIESEVDTMLDPDPGASWLSIDEIGGGGPSAAGAGFTATLTDSSRVPFANKRNYQGSRFAANAGDVLVCAAADISDPALLGLNVVGAPRPESVATAVGVASRGCRVVTTPQTTLDIRPRLENGSTTTPVTGPESRNWVSMDQLVDGTWDVDASSIELPPIASGAAATVAWMMVTPGSGTFDGTTFVLREQAMRPREEALVCVGIDVGDDAKAVELVFGPTSARRSVGIARGVGRLNGCGVASLEPAHELRVRVTNVSTVNSMMVTDQAAYLQIRRLH